MNYIIGIHFLDGSTETFIFSRKEDAMARIIEAFKKGFFSLTQGPPGQAQRDFYIPLSGVKEVILQVQVT
jgi:hypothetical protein